MKPPNLREWSVLRRLCARPAGHGDAVFVEREDLTAAKWLVSLDLAAYAPGRIVGPRNVDEHVFVATSKGRDLALLISANWSFVGRRHGQRFVHARHQQPVRFERAVEIQRGWDAARGEEGAAAQ